eukprot:CAMPEP_0170498434 /NCGR_PEP_ID=MMETSP0208-20121228/27805_1 /TAXON_ID=197538 /ORGANISM="Strombidium inclinatum, Strain S3" /LENGTH=110 /DNA_ID=CAMNT_0010775605 /DNA_START=309 /DNA_END=641 /DNA_ORIENTATION=-
MSERFATDPDFKGLKLKDDGSQAMVNDTRETVNFKELKSVLLSKDPAVYEPYQKKFLDDGVLRFLDKTPLENEKVAYLTYARSGNTFLRQYLELVTGVATGSEMPVCIPN